MKESKHQSAPQSENDSMFLRVPYKVKESVILSDPYMGNDSILDREPCEVKEPQNQISYIID